MSVGLAGACLARSAAKARWIASSALIASATDFWSLGSMSW
jgi:hypothetical protein